MLIISLFVIVVLSLLGVTLMKTLGAASESVIYEIYGVRALNAAKAGIEANIARVFPVDGTSPVCGSLNSAAAFSQLDGLKNCRYESRCTQDNVVVNGMLTRTYYRFNSQGICDAGNMLVSRSVSVDAMQ